jgi:DNA-binding Lrp family transcriptional regulator
MECIRLGAEARSATVEQQEVELPSPNDLEILRAIGGEFDTEYFAFQGIKRKLGLHQETLARAFHRLEKDGFIERIGQAYRLSSKGHSVLGPEDTEFEPTRLPDHEIYSVPIVRTILPSDVMIEDLFRTLERRWFGNLRWFGSRKGADYVTMTWVTDDGKLKLTARISENMLVIEAFPATKDNMSAAVRAAYRLFDHITQALKSGSAPQVPSAA